MDARIQQGMAAQLGVWREKMAAGDRRVGWKVALNLPAIQAKLSLDGLVVANLLASGVCRGASQQAARWSCAGATNPCVEPEIAIELGCDLEPGADHDTLAAAIRAIAPAFEVVDLDAPMEDLQSIIATNIFQRAVAFGDFRAGCDLSGSEAAVRKGDGEETKLDAGVVAGDLVDTLGRVLARLGDAGAKLLAGDRIITGSLVAPIPVGAGDCVFFDLTGHSRAALHIDP